MKESLKKNWALILLGLATVILGLIATVSALRLYQLRKQPVAPTAPVSKPKAVSPQCVLRFSLEGSPTSTSTPTFTPTLTPPLTATPTPTPSLTSTPSPPSSVTPTSTPTATFTPTPPPLKEATPSSTSTPRAEVTPTPTSYVAKVELPEAGFTLPTLGAILGGIILVIASALLLL